MGVQLQLQPDRNTARAGGTLTGTVEVEADRETRCRALVLSWSWRTIGKGTTAEGLGPAASVFQGVWAPGRHTVSFEIPVPDWPLSLRGKLIGVVWTLTARAEIPWGADPHSQRFVEVTPGPGSDRHLEQADPPRHAGRTAAARAALGLVWGGAALALMILGRAQQHTPELRLGLQVPSLILFVLGLVYLALAVRNRVAERRLGRVFVGLEPTICPGQELELLVRLTPPGPVSLNGITATLVGEETTVRGSGKRVETERHRITTRELRLSGPRELRAGEPLEADDRCLLPGYVPYSFQAPHNRIEYRVEVRVDVAGWPDWVHTYALRVQPFPAGAEPRPARLVLKPSAGQRCPYCRDELAGATPAQLVSCAGCRTTLHRECMRELGTCPIRGCDGGGAPPPRRRAPRRRRRTRR